MAGWFLKSAHGLLLHDHDHAHAVCDAPYEGADKHFHDERFSVQKECPFCVFSFGLPDGLQAAPSLPVQEPGIAEADLPSWQAPSFSRAINLVSSRGPPAIAASVQR